MRIIAGKYKSRRLKFPQIKSIRPTMDRVRETVFNVIGAHIKEAHVLDLCAGSGSYGFEALSRGAEYVYFVEFNNSAISIINENTRILNVADQVAIKRLNVLRAVSLLHKESQQFRVIFFDPPYSTELTKKTLMKIYQSDILAPNGMIIVEHSIHDNIILSNSFLRLSQKQFGETYVTFIGAEAR